MKFAYVVLLAAPVLAEEPYSSKFEFNSDKGTTSENIVSDPSTNSKISEMRRKFDDYFAYSFDGKNITNSDAAVFSECSTSQECSDSGQMTKCCMNTVLLHEATGTQDVMYKCMTKSIADVNIDMYISDFKVNMKCLGSGASILAVGASLLTLSAITLY